MKGARGAAGNAKDFRSDGIEGENFVSQSGGGNGSGHTPDGAGGFVLSEDGTSLLTNEAASEGSIGAHAGEHDGEDAGAIEFCYGAEEHVNGGTTVILKRALGEVQGRRSVGDGGGQSFEVPVAAGYGDGSGADRIGLGGLTDAKIAAAVEAFCEEARKEFGHVLHDEDGQGEVGGQRGKQEVEGRGAAGGDTDGKDGRDGGDGLRSIR